MRKRQIGYPGLSDLIQEDEGSIMSVSLVTPFFWKVLAEEYCGHRAGSHTNAAVDAVVRVDVELSG